jgi:hypothetical protein
MLFLVTGTDFAGRRFEERFDAASEDALRNWMANNGISVESARAAPLTWGPYARFPRLILAFPILAGVFLYTILVAIRMIAFAEGSFPAAAVGAIIAFDALLVVPLYNILMRLGSHYEFDDGRIVQYAKGDCVVTSEDAQDR